MSSEPKTRKCEIQAAHRVQPGRSWTTPSTRPTVEQWTKNVSIAATSVCRECCDPLLQQAEGVALGVLEDMPGLLAGLPDVGRTGAQGEEPLQLFLLGTVCRTDVDVEARLVRIGGVGLRQVDGRLRSAEPVA